VTSDVDRIEQFLQLGTTFTHEQLAEMSAVETHSLARVVAEMTEYDLSLYPFMSAFVTTSTSEQLWFSKGAEITALSQTFSFVLPDFGSELGICLV
jgi:hypothetical protein